MIGAQSAPLMQDFMYYRTESNNYVEKYLNDLHNSKINEVNGVDIFSAGLIKLYSSLSVKSSDKITKGVFTTTRAEACNYNAGKLFKLIIESGSRAIILNPKTILALMNKYNDDNEIGGNIQRNYYGDVKLLEAYKNSKTWCDARKTSMNELVHPSRSEVDRPILSRICKDFGVKTVWANWQDFFEVYICDNDGVKIEDSFCSSILRVPSGVVNCYLDSK